MGREAKIERKTKETEVRLKLNLDGSGLSKVDTGIPF
ncbi:MAG: imidazoleglycerol-phosphate dehydratase, partial [Desulfobacteraceae bacterium]|nr:imidazoleglycerol-phosphate dehydratase [Desulfobacteraceae bacterium]